MKRISSLLCGIGIIALQACSAAPQGEGQDLASSENSVAPYAFMPATLDWGTGYTAQPNATNPLSVAAKSWSVVVDLKSGSIQKNSSGLAVWSAIPNKTSGIVSFVPSGTPAPVNPGTTAALFTFNVVNPAAGMPKGQIIAYNFKMDSFKTCESNSGKKPAKAALAVAMADELGRWAPELDLYDTHNDNGLDLSPSAVCLKNNCANTKAILGQQTYTPNQALFNNTDFRSDLQSSISRQQNIIDDLKRNQPAKAPISDYTLTQVAGPVTIGTGSCGPHYVFQVDYKSTGQPLSATDAANLMATMCFFDGYTCGTNPYLGYITQNIPGCPAGKQCIAIDPTDGDNNSGSTTTAGSAPSYPFDRVYNPTNSLLNSACITAGGLYGTLISKCSISPRTCGTLYCIAQ